MQVATLLGIPYPIWGFICFILALVFMYVLWPKPKEGEAPRPFVKNMILHYFHPLTWVLLGMAAFMQARFVDTAVVLAGVGGIVFVMFILTLLKK